MKIEDIVGVWDLVSLKSYGKDGSIHYPLGKDAKGYLIYTNFGYMSGALWRTDRPRVGVPLDEMKKLPFPRNVMPILRYMMGAKSYVSYAGTFEIRGDCVIHHVKSGSYVDWIDTDNIRRYVYEPPRLTLFAEDHPGAYQELIWTRVA